MKTSPIRIANVALVGAVIAAACFTLHLTADNPPAAKPAAAALGTDPFIKKGAPDPADATGPQANLIFTYEMYRLSQTEGAQLLQDNATDQARYDHLRDLVKQGKARLDALLCGAVDDGNQVVVEQCDTLPYPISYWLAGGGKTLQAADFNRRSIGRRLVIKAQTLKGNDGCDVSMFPEFTVLRGFIDRGSNFDGTLFTAPQPVFETQRLNTKPPILPFDQIRLIGTFSPPATDSLPMKKPQPQAAAEESEMGLMFAHVSRVQYDPGVAPGSKYLGVDLELTAYSMERDEALRILSQPQRPGSAFEGVQALLKANQAKLEHMTVIRTRPGLKANSDEISEDIYPTGGNDQWVTQDTGFSSEIRPVLIGNGSIVSLDISKFQFLKDIGPLQAEGLAGSLVASQPIFALQSIVTNINAIVGEHALLGTISPPGDTGINGVKDDGRVWLAFVRATMANP